MRSILSLGAMGVVIGALAVFGSGWASASDPAGNRPSLTGSKITVTPPSSKGTIGGLRPRAATKFPGTGGVIESPYHRYRSAFVAEGPAGRWEEPASPGSAVQMFTSSSALAPSLSRSFDGLDLNDIGSMNPTGFIPPDTMGAAGPGHLVNIVNGGIRVMNKTTGNVDNQTSLQSFWSPLGIGAGQPADDVFDPKVLYDQSSGRFIAVSIGGRSAPDSWILLAVSTTSNPNDAWNLYAIDADHDADGIVRNNWADFPCLGVDSGHVYVTANMFQNGGPFQYMKCWIFQKPELLLGAASLTVTELRKPPGSGGTSQPAHVFGAAPAEYVASAGWADTSPPTRLFVRIATITFPGGVGTWTDLGFVRVNGYSVFPPDAPQPGGGAPIDMDDGRLSNLVYRNGLLYTAHTVTPTLTDNTRSEIAWYEINPASTSASISTAPPPAQQGRISDPSRFYFYPSIAVNSRRDIVIGFSGSSPTEFAGAYYSYRSSSDPAGAMAAAVILRQGVAAYTLTGSGTRNRWGDFSATCLDPVSDNTFWTIQEYAKSTNIWGTVWGAIEFGPPPPSPLGAGGIFGPAGSDGGGGGCSIGPAGPKHGSFAGAGDVFALLIPAVVIVVRRKILARRSPWFFRR